MRSQGRFSPRFTQRVCLRAVRFSLGVIRQTKGFDPMSCEYDTAVVTDSPSIKKKKKKKKRKYKSMIGSLLYVTTSRPDVMQEVGHVALFQEAPKESHVLTVKRIFRYLKGT
jgi:hypothetical protein